MPDRKESITLRFSDEQREWVRQESARLTELYGVPVSESEIVRRCVNQTRRLGWVEERERRAKEQGQ